MSVKFFRLFFAIAFAFLAAELYFSWGSDVSNENYVRSYEDAININEQYRTLAVLSNQIKFIDRAIKKYYQKTYKLPKAVDDFGCIDHYQGFSGHDDHCDFSYLEKSFYYQHSGYWLKVTAKEVDYRLVIDCTHNYEQKIFDEFKAEFTSCVTQPEMEIPYELRNIE